ncbi:hypothetical protein HY448_01640 [Candidatus Pacearchaeota archaeon]|nr:hypothetical protein [Candidatus Pacearchaeota archaeon]
MDIQKEIKALKEDIKNIKNSVIELLDTANKIMDGETKTSVQMKSYIENTDSWIKQIKRNQSESLQLPSLINENADNIQHNYELIYELKDQIEELKQEINAIKLIQIISLKQKTNRNMTMIEQQTLESFKRNGAGFALKSAKNNYKP